MSKLISAIEKALAKEYNKGFDKGETAGYSAGVDHERKRIVSILIEAYAHGYKNFWEADEGNAVRKKRDINTAELIKWIESVDEAAK